MTNFNLTKSDLRAIANHGLTKEQIQAQIVMMKRGIPWATIQRACTIGNGIIQIPSSEIDRLTQRYTEAESAGRIMKFVPASGAASRMFQSLVEAYNQSIDGNPEVPITDAANLQILQSIRQLAFSEDLSAVLLKEGLHLETLLQHKRYAEILGYLLLPQGLDYTHRPKALIKFHRYSDHSRTPLEEHLVEGAEYTQTGENIVRIHFTVSPEHQESVSMYVNEVKTHYEQDGAQFEISYSQQKPSTDTIAVDEKDEPFRNQSGGLVLRPAGHGALIENLSDLHADIVFIKNIDNVVPDRLKNETCRYKKILGGILLSAQQDLFGFLEKLDSAHVEESTMTGIFEWGRHTFSLAIPSGFATQTHSNRIKVLRDKLNRPIRVCGMIKNTNEPGGRPFWVQQGDGTRSIQIVEMAQIDTESITQRALLESSTHFNPVDIVCGLRDYRGNAFDLRKFVDPNTGIITTKSHEGRTLKALEHPGLWNGGMAHWNTIFVEIPASTFNPVKTVLDLLRPEHQ